MKKAACKPLICVASGTAAKGGTRIRMWTYNMIPLHRHFIVAREATLTFTFWTLKLKFKDYETGDVCYWVGDAFEWDGLSSGEPCPGFWLARNFISQTRNERNDRPSGRPTDTLYSGMLRKREAINTQKCRNV